jgi:hypothetical protein
MTTDDPTTIELTYPTQDELRAAYRLLGRYGQSSREEIISLACYGDARNPRPLMQAAGQVVMTFRCPMRCGRPLDPTDKDSLGLDLCPQCFEEAGWENDHSDNGHETPVPNCPTCKAEAR